MCVAGGTAVPRDRCRENNFQTLFMIDNDKILEMKISKVFIKFENVCKMQF